MSKSVAEFAQMYAEAVVQEKVLRERFAESVQGKREAAVEGVREALTATVNEMLAGTPFEATIHLKMRDTGDMAE